MTKIDAPPATIPTGPPQDLSLRPAQDEELPIRKLHRLLKGRYLWVVLSTLTGAVLLGTLGWFSAKRDYESTGNIQIRGYVPRVLYQTDQGGVLPMFDSYLSAQEALLKSRRVIDMAMGSEAWHRLGRGQTDADVASFVNHLEVQRQGEMIWISFHDANPDVAVTAVKTIIEAYEQIYHEQDSESQSERLRVLQERRNTLTNQISSLRERIFAIANEFGSDGLQKLYEFKLDELNKIESRMRNVELALALVKGNQLDKADAAVLEALAKSNPQIQALWQKRMADNAELHQLLTDSHFGPNHRVVLEVRREIGSLDDQIKKLTNDLRTGRMTPAGGAAEGETALAPEALEVQQKQLQQLYEKNQAEALDLGRKNLQIEALKAESTNTQQRLDETKLRLEQINVESVVGGRLVINDKGERPVAPSSDKRRQMAVLGALAGGGLGFGFVVFIGLFSRTIRHPEEALSSTGWAQLLGILPHLPEELADENQARLAAHGVHHIRTMLQVAADSSEHPVFTVSSCSSGTGKTSLSLALGLSYAESGARVLLIDGDLISGGLTRRLDAIVRERLGRILVSRGRISSEQLTEALAQAKQSGCRLGEVLIERRLLTAQELRECLTIQEENTVGLLDALRGGELSDYCTATGTPALFLLPRGRAGEQDGGRVSPVALERLLAQARAAFDAVIIDTGPILASVESSMLCAAADKVIIVVSRGDEKKMVERGLQMLRSVGGRLAGFVFNRADEGDFIQSFYSPSPSPQTPGAQPDSGGNGAGKDRSASGGNGSNRSVAGALLVRSSRKTDGP